MSSLQLLYTSQTWVLRCELKQNRNPEERNAGNMPEFLVNRLVVVLVENKKLPSVGTSGPGIVDSFRIKVGVILKREKEENK